ncbi:MAG: family 20 glycosylhydrolase [Acidobacteriota bacterium]
MVERLPFLVGALMMSWSVLSGQGGCASHDLMPVPSEVTWQEGALSIDARFRIEVAGKVEVRVREAVGRAMRRLDGLLGQRTATEVASGARLLISCENEGEPVQLPSEDESYQLVVTPQQAELRAATPLGALRGLETFLQLIEDRNGSHVVPAVKISDQPRFPWRGLLIDSCRHWMPLEVIKRNLDGMAAVKLNVLHWHLTDDQGFRIESKRFPRLHELGSKGQYYTQEQIRDVLAYARARAIRVVPEFDMPGHVTSWLVGHPELGSAPGPYQIEKTFGIKDPAFDPTREEVYEFLDAFLGEMAALFPDPYLHIGGDEVNGKQWNANERIQKFKRQQKLKDNHDLQAYFNQRLSQILSRHGKKMVGWDEILHPDLPRDIVVQSWRGTAALAEAAQRGYDGLLSNGYYIDLAWPAARHYAYDPLPAGHDLTPEQQQHVLGGEATMWTELVSEENVDSRIWPRTAAIAERLWSPARVRDVHDMYRRLEIQSARLNKLGLTHQSSYQPMLERLAGSSSVEMLKNLADVVEPVEDYARHHSQRYTTEMPLNRLADTARPESVAARHFKNKVDACLEMAPQVPSVCLQTLRTTLEGWRDNHQRLRPTLETSDLLRETIPLSEALSVVGQVGIEAVGFLEERRIPDEQWAGRTTRELDQAQKPKAESELAVVPAVRKLVLAARQFDLLKSLSVSEWIARLEAQVEAAKAKPKEGA